VRLTLAYDGGDFHGWQMQPRGSTVQGALLAACRQVLGEHVRVVAASRTDAGVHARGQVVSVQTDAPLLAASLARALNAVLPAAIRVREAADAPAAFDARRWAVGKRYLYLIDGGPVANPFLRRFAWHVPVPLDQVAMVQSLRALRGHHDFSAFCAAPGRGRSPLCALRSARLRRRRHVVAIALSADSFLHHMVRNIVGSLVEVGRGARPAHWLSEVLAGRDRTRAGPTAPARGLTLLSVQYWRDEGGRPIPPAGERDRAGQRRWQGAPRSTIDTEPRPP
jgi:tRNA pseudouridine38-40 synthase